MVYVIVNRYYFCNTSMNLEKKAFQDSFPDSHFDIFDIFKNVNFIKRPPEFVKKRGCD